MGQIVKFVELEKVQNRAARFVTGNYVFETGSMTGILGQLKWESLKKRRKDSRLILLYKGLKGKARIPTDDLIPKSRRCRNQHSLAFQIPSASKEAYKSSFFPQTIRDWNDLPYSLVSSAEMSDDCVSKFASLVRSIKGLISPPSEPPGEIMSFGVSPVNYSDSELVHDCILTKQKRNEMNRRYCDAIWSGLKALTAPHLPPVANYILSKPQRNEMNRPYCDGRLSGMNAFYFCVS